ncbi:MAG TPA: cobalt-factor II C(20)-methyltransferase [Methanothrix sp.]|nr:cobalt-factor II C(20)-methyltransferase [Methanothrix sp.]HOK58807.1 cobalt-factor II C(20)-methyltransferase [Methanothrix sp.]HOL43951.1 cobalt-factor II C(20)-methyltransferase [Methanothrix sp.]HPO88989.1 cobalt-factor II C(20)-methyltransferase [Methanothrix sp.]
MLVGVSLGPGDPGLLTLRAIDVLRTSEKVFAPGELAAELARPYCEPEILDFPMTDDLERLEEIWERNADTVASYAEKCLTSFACLGDVNTFSTFSHLRRVLMRRHPGIEIDTVPGVGIIPAAAARFGIGFERSFLVSDGSEPDAVLRLKATRPASIAAELHAQGYSEFILGSRLYTADEMIVRGEMPERSSYFSVLYARRVR